MSILKTTGIDHLNLEVIDLEETVKFYKDLFGFRVLKEQPEENSKIIGNDKVKLCLYQTGMKDKYVKKGFAHFGLHIDNYDEVLSLCKEMGIEIYYGGELKWEKSASVYIQDPNGYEIELTKVFGGGL